MKKYPSIEKPWLKFYAQDAIDSNVPEIKMYDYIKEFSKGHECNECLQFFGKKITYSELIRNVESVAKGFISLGVKEGEMGSIDIELENGRIQSANQDFFKCFFINNIPWDAWGELLETDETRRLKQIYLMHGI